jgi:hypothetical protein
MDMRPSRSPLASRLLIALAVGATVLLGVVGCGGSGGLYSRDVGYLAEQYLPTTRRADAHPDSVRHLSIVTEDEQIKFELDEDYQDLHTRWSCTFQVTTASGSVHQPLTYATLWSKELSLAALQADRGITSLTRDQALKMIEEREEEYQNLLQIDVYWFSGPDGTAISGPGAQVRLRDGQGNTYRPVRDDHGPLREAFITGGNSALYRRNMFYFKRTVDGRDIIDDIETLRLTVAPTAAPRVRFEWTWDE